MLKKVDNLRVGDVLETDVLNISGVLLLGKGAVLGPENIKFLKSQDIFEVHISDFVDLEAGLDEKVLDEQKRAVAASLAGPPAEYKLDAEIINNHVDERSQLKAEYKAGIEAIRNIKVDESRQIAKDICEKIASLDNVQSELALLKNGCDSVLTHSMNVAIMTASIVVWQANVTSADCYEAVTGAMLHDIGKLYVSRDILEKPARLTEMEYKLIQQHAELGYTKLLAMGGNTEKIARMAYEHHENNDGTGYPRGISGDQIMMESKIIHVADVYEAMTARRCYKPPLLPGDATEYTMTKYGTMFDQDIVKTFLHMIPAYKTGDIVMLSNTQLAEVVESNPYNSLRPKIRILQTGEIVDLYRSKDLLNLTIVGMA